MSDDKDRDARPFGEPHELSRYFLNLTDATRRRGQLFRIDRLDGIDHDGRRLDGLYGFQDLFERRFGQNQQMRMLDPQPLPPHLDLTRRLLARDVEDRLRRRRQARQRLQQQGGFPNARVSSDQNDRARNHPSTQHSVEFADPGEATVLADDFDLADRRRLRLHGLHRDWTPLARGGLSLFLHGIPAAAVRTATQPPRRLMPAGLTGKDGLCFHERGSLNKWCDSLL